MSYSLLLKNYLSSASFDDPEHYIKATHMAINGFLAELETRASIHMMLVNGTTTNHTSVVPIIGPLAKFEPLRIRCTYDEVKKALFCGDPNMSFFNLFDLIGSKITKNFSVISINNVVIASTTTTLTHSTFKIGATSLLAETKVLGATITPDIFGGLIDKNIKVSLNTIPPMIVPIAGSGVTPPGVFTGTVTVSFFGFYI